MSTLNSTNMQVTRPTTKVRHAPGGQSSINLSFAENTPAAKPVVETPKEPMVEVRYEPALRLRGHGLKGWVRGQVAVEVPAAETLCAAVEAVVLDGVSMTVGVVYAPCSAGLEAQTVEALRARGVGQVTLLQVPEVLQLPFGAKKLLDTTPLDAVIVVGQLPTEVRDLVWKQLPRGGLTRVNLTP
jgi:hypothetical protein